MDTEGRWTLKRGRTRSAEPSEPHERTRSELVIPVFGDKNHLGIDRRHGFIRRFAVSDAARHDGRQLGRLLDPHNTASAVWADSASRSAANVALLAESMLDVAALKDLLAKNVWSAPPRKAEADVQLALPQCIRPLASGLVFQPGRDEIRTTRS
jgi:hypothetical protein